MRLFGRHQIRLEKFLGISLCWFIYCVVFFVHYAALEALGRVWFLFLKTVFENIENIILVLSENWSCYLDVAVF